MTKYAVQLSDCPGSRWDTLTSWDTREATLYAARDTVKLARALGVAVRVHPVKEQDFGYQRMMTNSYVQAVPQLRKKRA